MFVGKAKAEAYLRMEHHKFVSTCMLLPYSRNIIVRWKCLPRAKILVYYEHSYIIEVKSFITLSPGAKIFVMS
jgi:hypothetical protein